MQSPLSSNLHESWKQKFNQNWSSSAGLNLKNQKDSRNQPRLNVKLRGAFNQTDPERKENQKKSSPLLSATILNVNYSLEDHMSLQYCLIWKNWAWQIHGRIFFFQVQVSRHLIFYARTFYCDWQMRLSQAHTLERGIDVSSGISVGPWTFGKNNNHSPLNKRSPPSSNIEFLNGSFGNCKSVGVN